MVSTNCLILLLCFGHMGGISSQNNLDNYIIIKNDAETIEYKFTASVADFLQLHSPPLGPLADQMGMGYDYCLKGIVTKFREINYVDPFYTDVSREERCSSMIEKMDSVLFLGGPNSKNVNFYAKENAADHKLRYNEDVADITLPNTNSLVVVGDGVNATFYALPNYGGASVCVTVVGTGNNFYKRVDNTTNTFGFSTIRSFKFGCNSKKIIFGLDNLE